MAHKQTPAFLNTTPPPVPLPSPDRLSALYAFTRAQREANPDGYAANVKWWGDVIAATLRSGYLGASGEGEEGTGGDVLVLNVAEGLLDRLANGGQRPRGLGGVIVSVSD